MSFRSTTSLLSVGQMYCCFTRPPHFLCSMLKLACSLEAAVKSFTGMETRPKLTVPEAMARAGMANSSGGRAPMSRALQAMLTRGHQDSENFGEGSGGARGSARGIPQEAGSAQHERAFRP